MFESKKKVNTIPGPDTKIIILEMPFISYPVIQLNGHFELYFNSVLRLKKPKEQGWKWHPISSHLQLTLDSKASLLILLELIDNLYF